MLPSLRDTPSLKKIQAINSAFLTFYLVSLLKQDIENCQKKNIAHKKKPYTFSTTHKYFRYFVDTDGVKSDAF